jgi:hypothetical protein
VEVVEMEVRAEVVRGGEGREIHARGEVGGKLTQVVLWAETGNGEGEVLRNAVS